MTGKPYPIKVWLERSGNKLGVVGDAGSWAEATKHVDFIVHMFNYPTSFSMYADMLLPTNRMARNRLPRRVAQHRLGSSGSRTHLGNSA